jgi:universal stress protein E
MHDTILLIAAGPRQHTPALQRAFDLARRAEIPVHICLLVHDPLIERSSALINPEVRRLAQQQFLDENKAWLDTLIAAWRADGLETTGAVAWAPRPEEAILAAVVRHKPALVIKDVGRDSLLRRITYTALDWKLVRHCPAPLMLVHGLSTHLPRRILAAVDTAAASGGGGLNGLILREALKLGDWSDADVELGHVFPYLPFSAGAHPSLESVYAHARNTDEASFKAFAGEHQVPEAARHWREGNPVERLIDMVKEQGIDLLVLGSAQRPTLERVLLGSTAETVLFQSPCDVLLVRPPDVAAALTARARPRAA